MTALKKILMVSTIVFLITSTLAIVVALSINTNFFRSETFVSCIVTDTPLNNFTLSISKRDDTVKWQGTDIGRKRTVEYVSDSSLKMNWKNDAGENVTFILNRLDGDFYFDSGKRDAVYGSCRERTPKF